MTTINAVNNGLSGSTGTGNFVGSTSPTLVTPALGTPSSGTLTSCTGLPISGITGLGTGVGTALGQNVSGSGSIVLTTSATLVTPTLGAASATSVNFGQTSLSYYGQGTWTPTDASGASLTFSAATGGYTRIGDLVIASCQVTYPVTVNGNLALIGSLPFTSNSSLGDLGGTVCYTTISTLFSTRINGNSTSASLFNNVGAGVTNATLSTGVFYLQYIYKV